MSTKSRSALVSAAAAALLIPLFASLAGAAPASATSPRPHDVVMYKVEKQVDLSGEYPDNTIDTTLACSGGDYVLQGMWRVDHVDQVAPPLITGDERDVYVTGSYGDVADSSQWHFQMTNYADGDAQVKLFLTCLRGQVQQAFGHTHGIVLGKQQVDASLKLSGAGYKQYKAATTCPAGQLVVAPGFKLSDQVHKVRLAESWYGVQYLGWTWGFWTEQPAPTLGVSLTMRCLQVKTDKAGTGPHAHNLMWAGRPNPDASIPNQALSVVGAQERRLSCDDGTDGKYYQDYKAEVASFKLDYPDHAWFLGMDPRPKTRAYKFWWDGTGGTSAAYLGLMCVRTQTGKQVAP